MIFLLAQLACLQLLAQGLIGWMGEEARAKLLQRVLNTYPQFA